MLDNALIAFLVYAGQCTAISTVYESKSHLSGTASLQSRKPSKKCCQASCNLRRAVGVILIAFQKNPTSLFWKWDGGQAVPMQSHEQRRIISCDVSICKPYLLFSGLANVEQEGILSCQIHHFTSISDNFLSAFCQWICLHERSVAGCDSRNHGRVSRSCCCTGEARETVTSHCDGDLGGNTPYGGVPPSTDAAARCQMTSAYIGGYGTSAALLISDWGKPSGS